MGSIDWIPIADLPEYLKDGRDVLLWSSGSADVAIWWESGLKGRSGWITPEGVQLGPVTHFAEIDPPESSGE